MIADEMRQRLEILEPSRLEVIDESESHRGQTHFRIRMASARFAGLGHVARHRLVHGALGDIVPRIHALALELAES